MSDNEQAHNKLSQGKYFNTGNGPTLQIIDIGHAEYMALIDPDIAFWSLIPKDDIGKSLCASPFLSSYREKRDELESEIFNLRFNLKPSAVYFNPTDLCNLNCTYCYIPENTRKNGGNMTLENLRFSFEKMKEFFSKNGPEDTIPQIIFHGAEPLMNRDAVFTIIDEYKDNFQFGIQTNSTLMDDYAIDFLTSKDICIGLSLDGPDTDIADRLRVTWSGDGVSRKVIETIKKLEGYENFSVICTATTENMHKLPEIVEYFHELKVPCCMLNPVRCTLQKARTVKPDDSSFAVHYLQALTRSFELYKQTGRKLVIANFANIILSLIAPSARKLMCDISPCGGGRCFFAVAANGDLFPCSEFIGLSEFKGGNIFKNDLSNVMNSDAFKMIRDRKTEVIDPCSRCAIRHFCGAPCPAEAHEMRGGMNQRGAFCELYEEQVRFALRLIAEENEDAFLWNNWDRETVTSFDVSTSCRL
jgi:uncharacterized protein